MSSINIDNWFPRNLRLAMRKHRSTEFLRHKVSHSDKRFDCEIAVHRDWQLLEAGQQGSAPDGTVLATFRHNSITGASIKLSATRLRREMTPADWLESRLQEQHRENLARREFDSPMGALPDVLFRSVSLQGAVIQRTTAIKDADRLFIVETSEPEAVLPRLANQFLITLSSFKLLNPERIVTAERIRTVNGAEPFFRCVLPESWLPSGRPGRLQMPLVFHNPGPGANVGELHIAVVAKHPDMDSTFLAAQYLSGLEKRGVRGGQVTSEVWTGNPVVSTAQLATAEAVCDGTKLDLRIAMLEQNGTTALVAVLGPARDVSFSAWAVNRRAFEIAAGSMQMANQSASTR